MITHSLLNRWTEVADRLERAKDRHWIAFASVAIPLLAIYSLTASWTPPYHIDATTNAITAWSIAHEGTVILRHHDHLADPEHRANLGFFVMSPSGTVGQYPPGAATVGSLFYLLSNQPLEPVEMVGTSFPERGTTSVLLPPLWPATLAAATATAVAVGLVALAILKLSDRTVFAVGAGLVLGLGTSAWSVASDALWTHGPGMLFIALSLVLLSRDRLFGAGLALGGAILVRPHLALVAACVGIWMSFSRRSLRPVWLVGIGSATGLAALLIFNYWIWETLTLSGGYGTAFTEGFVSLDPWWRVRNIIGALVNPIRGVLVWSPFLLVVIPASFAARKHADDWAVGAALGGIVYLLAQLMANRFSGGGGFFSYRYPLEALVAAAPFFAVGYCHWIRGRPVAIRILAITVVVAVTGQLVGAVLL